MDFGEKHLTAQLLPFLKQPIYWVCHPCSCKKCPILAADHDDVARRRQTHIQFL